jgi:hypothetical protein
MSTLRMDTKYENELLPDSHAAAKLMGVHPETVKRTVRCGNHPHRNFVVFQLRGIHGKLCSRFLESGLRHRMAGFKE